MGMHQEWTKSTPIGLEGYRDWGGFRMALNGHKGYTGTGVEWPPPSEVR